MTTTNQHRILTSRPVNKQAALGMSPSWRGERYPPPNYVHTRTPPIVYIFEGPVDDDLHGRMVGTMRVVGYAGKGGDGARWIVKCPCGAYESRASRAIKTNPFQDHACFYCDPQRQS